MAVTITHPFYPIIYVRGYAGSESEVEETVATPYMGFNLGSTKIRQHWKGHPVKHIFESPLVRLMKDYKYKDVYEDGFGLESQKKISPLSVIIFRYYDQVSKEFEEDPDRPDIEIYASQLGKLIETVRDKVCGKDKKALKAFKIYLVAHSMGGLICRCFLQNLKMSTPVIRKLVDKVFTYATPHNGIDVQVLGNVPGFFSRNNANNFNRRHMAKYLALKGKPGRVDTLDRKFDPNRFFCLVGTNDRDYQVAAGWSSRLVGPMSDGLVRIDNAAVRNAPRAFVNRCHSGHYGIVNSEDGYQNLVRFLFGNLRVDGQLIVKSITLPLEVQKDKDRNKKIKASYHFETIIRVRGGQYDLHRRTVEEGSAVFRRYHELIPEKDAIRPKLRHPRLFSQFLNTRLCTRGKSMVFSIDLRVLVPDYEIDGFLFLKDHIEGGSIFRDRIILEASPPKTDGEPWILSYRFESQPSDQKPEEATHRKKGDSHIYEIPIVETSRPGIDAVLELTTRGWQ